MKIKRNPKQYYKNKTERAFSPKLTDHVISEEKNRGSNVNKRRLKIEMMEAVTAIKDLKVEAVTATRNQ